MPPGYQCTPIMDIGNREETGTYTMVRQIEPNLAFFM